MRSMHSLPMIKQPQYAKNIFNKGTFAQFIVSPFATKDKDFHKVLIISDQVTEPSSYYDRSFCSALILPKGSSIKNTLNEHFNLVMSYTGCSATYFGLFGMDGTKLGTF